MDSRTTGNTSTASCYQRSNSESRKPNHGDWRAEAHDYEASRLPRSPTKETTSGSESFSRMKQELQYTLSLKARYTLPMLTKAYRNDTGKSAKAVAKLFEFSSFEEMLRSKELADIVEIDEIETSNGSIETLYLAKSVKDIKILDKEYDDQLKTISNVGEENFLEAKLKILKLLTQLGAEEKPVSFHNLVQAYLVKYRVALDKSEFKRLFGSFHPLKVFQSLMSKEVQVHLIPGQTGQFNIELKAPFQEIYAQLMEAKNKVKKPRMAERAFEDRPLVTRSCHHSETEFASNTFKSEKAIVRRSPTRRHSPPEPCTPSPQPTKEFPEKIPKKLPSTFEATIQRMRIDGLANVSNYRYNAKEQFVHNGKVYTKMPELPDFEESMKKNDVPYTQRGDGCYTDEEVEKPMDQTSASQKSAPQNGRAPDFYDDNDENFDENLIEEPKIEPKNYASHGEKWIQKSMELEKQRDEKKIRKLEADIQRLTEMKENAKNPAKNSQIFQLNEISQDIQISPKSATTNDDDEFEKLGFGFEDDEAQNDPPTKEARQRCLLTDQPLKEVNSKQTENASKESSNWTSDETCLRFRLMALRLNKMGLDKKSNDAAMRKIEKVLDEFDSEASKPARSARIFSHFVTDV